MYMKENNITFDKILNKSEELREPEYGFYQRDAFIKDCETNIDEYCDLLIRIKKGESISKKIIKIIK
jgi:hypothetical protein